MLWVATNGRASRVLPSEHLAEARARTSDLAAIAAASEVFLDRERSDFGSSPQLWASIPIPFGLISIKPATLVDPDEVTVEPNGSTVKGVPADGFTPTSITWRFGHYEHSSGEVSLIVGWDATIRLPIDRVAIGPAHTRFGYVFSQCGDAFIDRLVAGLNSRPGTPSGPSTGPWPTPHRTAD